MEVRSEGENLLLRRTQGDLLQKLRQLQQWRQQKEEHLLQDKEKQMTLLREKEKRLHAVQQYQRKILQNNNMVASEIENSPIFQGKPDFHDAMSSRPFVGSLPHSENIAASQNGTFGSNHNPQAVSRPVLLSPQHFKATTSSLNMLHTSPAIKPQNQMLLSQKLCLPSASDEEISQFTESDGGSVSGIEGIQPIENTPTELSQASDDDDDDDQFNSDHEDLEEHVCLVHNDHNNQDNDNDDDNIDDIDEDNNDHDIINDNIPKDNHNKYHSIDDIDQDDNDCDIIGDNIAEDSDNDDHSIDDNIEEFHGTDILNSFARDFNKKPSFDDEPIKAGLGGQTRTFEEMLNEQLQAEENQKHEEPSRAKTTTVKKRTFLKKGEGIARFGLKPKPESKLKPITTKTGKDAGERKVQVTRKTVVLKEHETSKQPVYSAVKGNTAVKQTAVDSSRKSAASKISTVQQNTGPATKQTLSHESDQEKQQFSPKKVQFNTRQSFPHGLLAEGALEEDWESCSEGDDPEDGGDTASRRSEVIIEDSFQERMKKWDELEVVEKQELNEFELLEEAAAANCSLSSNSSTVLKFLGKQNKQSRGDVNNNILVAIQKSNFVSQDLRTDDDSNRTLTEENLDDQDDTLKEPDVTSSRSSLALSDGFDDTKTWDDHDALDVSDVNHDVIQALNTSTPDEKSERRNAHAQNRMLVTSSSTPPTSSLVTKLFPRLKTKNETSQCNVNSKQPPLQQSKPAAPATTRAAVRVDPPDGTDNGLNNELNTGVSNAVRDKLQELEKEIEKFREENIALHKLREEREKDLRELQNERASFEKYKTEELQRLEDYKVEEEKRLRRDKRVFEQYQKASRALPDKKEREEIISLKAKISELQDELKLRESRWSAAATRYKDRINNLEKENKEAKEEVKLLEKQNLDLQRKEQQKIRELQQYKAFEKKKLKKPEEMKSKKSPTINVPRKVEQEVEDFSDKDEIINTATKNVSPSERKNTFTNVVSNETQEVKKISKNDSVVNTQGKAMRHSPPTKQVNSPKNVRFKDDVLEETKLQETLPKQFSHSDGKREVINPDGSRVVTFTNGTRKEISADGLSVIVTFFNGDIKQIFPDEKVEYYYAEVQTTHTTYPDGLEVLRFPSNQIEKHYPDGTKEIIFPDETVKYLYTSGAEECVFTDGTVERISVDGEKVVEFPNGQRETYTKLFKKREYPDGTVKTVYTDGRQETRYASGRLRVKDCEGRLLVDTAEQNVQGQQSVAS